MSFTGDAASEGGFDGGRESEQAYPVANFQFVPKELATKCHKLIESYHAINGYRILPDMLWHSDGRDVIECSGELMQIFARASKSRSAKRANDSFLLLATLIVSVEVLARDLAGWGHRYPAAKREAEKLLADRPAGQSKLIDMYLYPSHSFHRDFTSGLVPPAGDQVDARN
jgi:hypothetical protein